MADDKYKGMTESEKSRREAAEKAQNTIYDKKNKVIGSYEEVKDKRDTLESNPTYKSGIGNIVDTFSGKNVNDEYITKQLESIEEKKTGNEKAEVIREENTQKIKDDAEAKEKERLIEIKNDDSMQDEINKMVNHWLKANPDKTVSDANAAIDNGTFSIPDLDDKSTMELMNKLADLRNRENALKEDEEEEDTTLDTTEQTQTEAVDTAGSGIDWSKVGLGGMALTGLKEDPFGLFSASGMDPFGLPKINTTTTNTNKDGTVNVQSQSPSSSNNTTSEAPVEANKNPLDEGNLAPQKPTLGGETLTTPGATLGQNNPNAVAPVDNTNYSVGDPTKVAGYNAGVFKDTQANTGDLGLSDNPADSNYANDQFNYGMTAQSDTAVSDKKCKSFIIKSYKSDPILKIAGKKIKERM